VIAGERKLGGVVEMAWCVIRQGYVIPLRWRGYLILIYLFISIVHNKFIL